MVENQMNAGVVTNGQLAVSIARIEERISSMADDINRLEAIMESLLQGSNGRPGLTERIVLNEQAIVGLGSRVSSLESKKSDSSKMPMKLILMLVGIIATLSTTASSVINHLMK